MNIHIGDTIKKIRTASNMTQKELADAVNVTFSSISAYENGTRLPSYEVLIKLASLFNISTDNLLGFSNSYVVNVSGLSPEQRNTIFEIIELYRLKNANNNSILIDRNVTNIANKFDIELEAMNDETSFKNKKD